VRLHTYLSGQTEDLLHQLLGLCGLLQEKLHDSCKQLQLDLQGDRRQDGWAALAVGKSLEARKSSSGLRLATELR
jgi:hypothetical protein